jgi:signal transduction histidine kinase/CheY-like chemotaxis protein/HAMP domain-containing protein
MKYILNRLYFKNKNITVATIADKIKSMNLKNIKISTQLKSGFTVLLLFVIFLGVYFYYENTNAIKQVKLLYEHPITVRKAIGDFQADILSLHRDLKDLSFTKKDNELMVELNWIKWWRSEALIHLNIIGTQYLGPKSDVDSLRKAYNDLSTITEETIRMIYYGMNKEVYNKTKTFGIIGSKVDFVMEKLNIISKFNIAKIEEIVLNNIELNKELNRKLIQFIVIIFLLSITLNYLIIRNIRIPLKEITTASQRFQNGDMSSRSSYFLKNEFGVLSSSFNNLVESIQENVELSKNTANLSKLMLSEYDIQKFFQTILNELANQTGSQIAAVYLLSSDKRTYDHFESIGTDENARQSFNAGKFEGEFGKVIFSRKIEHISIIPEDTRFVFYTVSGKIHPQEIITIPILAAEEVIAVISLASIKKYDKQAVSLINNIFDTLCARVEGILTYHNIKDFSKKLEFQNLELESQKSELASQSAELMAQNTTLEMQKAQLDEANRLKTNFLSNMSHELRTPLNSVIALTGVLSRRLLNKIPDEELSYLEVIERNGKNLLALINDILDISRIEAGREEFEITKLNPADIVSDIIILMQEQAKNKNIDLLFTSEHTHLSIISDEKKCRHILQNLIGNAIKFTEKGKVEIKLRQVNQNIIFTITDTGIGIAENHINHIFDEFRQADSSTSRRFGGTGLGLAIAKKYSNLLKGDLSVESTLGKGSVFTLVLPVQFSAENLITDSELSEGFMKSVEQEYIQPDPGTFNKTILLVDDSEPAIIQLKDILQESGYNILVANNGKVAIEIIEQTIPDAIILDLMMPGIDGFEVLKTIRNEEKTIHIPVLILTAKLISKEELSLLKQNHIHQLIQKGDINRNELLNSIVRMVFPDSGYKKEEKTLLTNTELRNRYPERTKNTFKGKAKVLIVEDNPDNMTSLKAILADQYVIIEAIDGNDVVEMAKSHHPNLILMDIALPGMDGIEAFKLIRMNGELEHIPVIALTASAMMNDRELILAYGFDSYLTKPIDEKILFKTINEILYGR